MSNSRIILNSLTGKFSIADKLKLEIPCDVVSLEDGEKIGQQYIYIYTKIEEKRRKVLFQR